MTRSVTPVSHPIYGTGILIRTFRLDGHDIVIAQFPGFPMATHHRATTVTVGRSVAA